MAQTNIKVSELVDKVLKGELTLPEMQRRYVWPATRVRDLLDSLYRGYPSGTILIIFRLIWLGIYIKSLRRIILMKDV